MGKSLFAALLLIAPMVQAGGVLSPVDFYSQGFEDVLGAEERSIQVVKLCKAQFPKECKGSKIDGYSDLKAVESNLIRFRPLFDKVDREFADVRIKSFADMDALLSANANDFRDKHLGYEIQFTAHHLAVLDVCGSESDKADFSAVKQNNFQFYWKMDIGYLARIDNYIANEKKKYESDLRKNNDNCKNILKIGSKLEAQITQKLKREVDFEKDSHFTYSTENAMTYVLLVAVILDDGESL